MATLGLILFSVGVLLFLGAKVIYKRNEKEVTRYKNEKSNGDKEFLSLVNNGMNIVKTVGAVLIILGALFILTFK